MLTADLIVLTDKILDGKPPLLCNDTERCPTPFVPMFPFICCKIIAGKDWNEWDNLHENK